jgi:hypothetical protein
VITKQQIKITLISTAVLVLLIIYGSFNPSKSRFFPKCPVKTAFHIDCPGCGSQRAVHALLHFDVVQAFKFNALLVIALPYLALALGLTLIKNPSEKITSLRNRLYGHHATLIVLGVVVFFGIFRNIL